MSKSNATTEKFIKAIPELSGRMSDLTQFFKDSKFQTTWTTLTKYQTEIDAIRFGMKEQAEKYSATVTLAIKEAENGQTIARKIIYLLGKIESRSRRDVLEDLLEGVQERVEMQVQSATRVKTGFESIRAGLLKIAAKKDTLVKTISEDKDAASAEFDDADGSQALAVAGAVGTMLTFWGPVYFATKAYKHGKRANAALEKFEISGKATDAVEAICFGIDAAVETVSKHVNFWADLNNRLNTELEKLGDADKLTKDNGRIKVGLVEESIDSWREVETQYKNYAADARLNGQILEASIA